MYLNTRSPMVIPDLPRHVQRAIDESMVWYKEMHAISRTFLCTCSREWRVFWVIVGVKNECVIHYTSLLLAAHTTLTQHDVNTSIKQTTNTQGDN